MTTSSILALSLSLALTTFAGAAGAPMGSAQAPVPTPPAGHYDVVLYERDLMIPMRDGVRMATDIYRPARNGAVIQERLPILLQRTPYDKDRPSAQARAFASYGYVVAVQDTRGRYRSEGVFSKYFEYDALDGHDTIEWLARLPYGTGKVGMWGTSYGAHTQADAAKLNPRGLGTLVVNNGGTSDGWDHTIRNNGTFELGRQIAWAFGQLAGETEDTVVRLMLEREKAHEWVSVIPFRSNLTPLAVVPNFEEYFIHMATHADGADWKGLGVNWVEYYDRTADVPMLHIGGWYDPWAGTTITNYIELSKRKRSTIRMLMGPWTHGGNARSFSGDVEFGADAAIADFAEAFHLRWFDHFLKGRATGVEREAPVRVFVMGTGDGRKDGNGRLMHGGYWLDAAGWPLPATGFTPYYLHGDGSLSPRPPAAGAPESTTYTHDPRHPVPTIGGQVSGAVTQWSPAGGFDQREGPDFHGSRPPYLPLKARPDVVVFQTEPLEADMLVAGPIVVRLFASSTAVDTDFMVKLVDVYPPSADYPSGYELNLTDRPIRARYRNGPDRPEPLVPGTIYEFEIRPFDTANVFKKGHRIRIDVSSSNFPRFDVNPNTGEPLGAHRRMITADNTIYHSPSHTSHVVLPLAAVMR